MGNDLEELYSHRLQVEQLLSAISDVRTILFQILLGPHARTSIPPYTRPLREILQVNIDRLGQERLKTHRVLTDRILKQLELASIKLPKLTLGRRNYNTVDHLLLDVADLILRVFPDPIEAKFLKDAELPVVQAASEEEFLKLSREVYKRLHSLELGTFMDRVNDEWRSASATLNDPLRDEQRLREPGRTAHADGKGFASKIRIREDDESHRTEQEFEAEFKERTGRDFPKTDLQWRELLAAAGFSPTEAREIRTRFRDESEIAEYFSAPGALLTEIYSRIGKQPAEWSDSFPPAHWRKVFGKISQSTLDRRVKDGLIRVKKVNAKLWRVAIDDLPSDYRP